MPHHIHDHEIRKLLLALPGKAIKILYDHYYQDLLKIACRLTHDNDAAKDIVQEAFAHLWKNARKLGNHFKLPIQYYLIRIVRNKSISYYHEKVALGQRKIQMMTDNAFRSMDQSVEARIIQVEMGAEILEIIARFPKRERECLMMKIRDELRNEEIALRLGVGVKAVERSLISAKKRLRDRLLSRS